MNYLVFVNELGPNYKGDNIYEFIFSDTKNVWDDTWDSIPANGGPQPPDLSVISKVLVLRNTKVELDLVQNSDFFSMYEATTDVVALAWEKEIPNNGDRFVFRFGDTDKMVIDKLYSRDIILEVEKEINYEI